MVIRLLTFLFLLKFSLNSFAQTGGQFLQTEQVTQQQVQEAASAVIDAVNYTEKQMCRNFRAVNSGEPLQGHLCEPYWPKKTAVTITVTPNSSGEEVQESGTSVIAEPSWADQVRERPDSVDKNSENYEGDSSPAQMAQLGLTMASPAELRAMETSYAAVRNQVADRCCGSNRECINAFRRVPLMFCTNPRATTHPNEPDRCTGRESGIFTFANEDENYMIWWLLKLSRLPAAERDATREAVLRERPHLRNKLGQIAPGAISISRYERAENPQTQWTLRHELGHACSNIRRQIATRNGSSLVPGYDYDSDPNSYCRFNPRSYQQYTFLDEFMRPDNSRQAGTCISNGIREEFRERGNEAYIPNACYGAKIEEGLAEAFALLTATPENIFHNLAISCTFPPSRVHFTGHKIVKCIADHSPRFRNIVLSAPICRADQRPESGSAGTEGGFGVPGGTPFMNNVLLSTPSGAHSAPAAVPSPAPAPAPAPAAEGSQQ